MLIAGLIAGVVINVGQYLGNSTLFRQEWRVIMETYNLGHVSGFTIIFFNVMALILGVVMVFLYASLESRLGGGFKTDLIIAILVWFLVWIQGFGGTLLLGIFPLSLVGMTVVWGLLVVIIASIAGDSFYRKENGSDGK